MSPHMEPTLPTWFKYRQGNAEPAGTNVLKLTAPNLPEAYVGIRAAENGNYQGAFRATADGRDIAVTRANLPTLEGAWGARSSRYRNHFFAGSFQVSFVGFKYRRAAESPTRGTSPAPVRATGLRCRRP